MNGVTYDYNLTRLDASTPFHLILQFQSRPNTSRQGAVRREWPFPLPRTATLHWRIWTAPFGQDDKQPPALLRSLALGRASPSFARLASGCLSSC